MKIIGMVRFPAAGELDENNFIRSDLENGDCNYYTICPFGIGSPSGYGRPFSCRHGQAPLGKGSWKDRRRTGSHTNKRCVYPLIARQEDGAPANCRNYQLKLPGVGGFHEFSNN